MANLARPEWQALREAHREMVLPWITPRLERRSRQESHPVDDFLFEYYPISAQRLLTWHPGINKTLQVLSDDFAEFPETSYRYFPGSDDHSGTLEISPEWLAKNQSSALLLKDFLATTHSRTLRSGCFGLHEWAMVLGANEVRHEKWPLRLSQTQIQATIDEVGLRCTHFDAFRFFTPVAAPLNPLQLTRIDQIEVEQPGCLHANMDLYKHTQRYAPVFGSDLVRQTFQLARDIRSVDMQVAPYDLAELGVLPIQVETQAGRDTFAKLQVEFASRAQQLRLEMISALESTWTPAEIQR
ncbi:MAG: 3-methyladenine DNA glycosylase [Candidatus Nanopelagicales bacterium]|nr:3-methyladenine DNA glycosylase [Candidatus Nanopelagicales bacterium]